MSGANTQFSRWVVPVLGIAAALTTARADPPVSGNRQTTVNPVVAETFAPLLANWIRESRDAALAEGVEPVPRSVQDALRGYVPDAVLERARWRAGGGGGLSLQQSLFRIGDYEAVTLDYVVVFLDAQKAKEDPKLWAHELKHVMQYAEWGIGGFAARYLRDYEAVEHDAAEYRWQFMKQAGLIPPVPAPPSE
jgi:Domain of unknown function (DUF4157)